MPTPDENNLIHAIADDCHDPDCELHHIDVAISEEVVSNTNVAFHIAGARALIDIAGSNEHLERSFNVLLQTIETAGGQ